MQTSEPIEEHELAHIKNDEKVQKALNEHGNNPKKVGESVKKQAPLLGLSALIFAVCATLFYLLKFKILPVPRLYLPLAQKIVLAAMFICLVLLANRLLKKVFGRKISDKTTLFNFERIANLFAGLLVMAIVLSVLFANWYTAMVSFGIVSLILGFALQNPITSFFGWIYILIRRPYEVGDRIRIGDVYGDVINVSYFDTTLWEVRGDYLSSDHPSGRIIRFVNSKVFDEYVYNYSWPLFPFIWNELNFYIAFESDFKFTSETIKRVAQQEIGEAMIRRVKRFKKILDDTPVDEFDVNEYPSVTLRADGNTWVQVVVRYLVEPKKSSRVKRQLFDVIMEELKKHPDKVLFPKTNMR
ncbi:mechanosensitive ion channel family protein [Pelobium manganitolerans]|uniref:mechanosensitive ion channel family protein n=1 Tax=Pelobium manganitolerans TaxID=1842495 RepID=UPI003FA37ADE